MSPDPSNEELASWSAALSLDELGSLAASFIEGDLRFFPGWVAEDVDEETDELIDTLVAFNHSGFLTVASQPGRAPSAGFGGHVFAQRAFVAGFASPATADVIGSLALDTELIISAYASTDRGGCRVPVSRRGEDTTAWAGQAAGPEEIEIFAEILSPQALECLRRSRYLSIIDPNWERRDTLWESVRAALEVSAHGDARDP